MGLIDLYDGIAVVIDDEIHKSDSRIDTIVQHLEDRNIPVVKFTELPDGEAIKHLHSASFIILDWELKPDLGIEDSEAISIKIPEGFYEAQNLAFIKAIRDISYCPIFIFTNQPTEKINDYLNGNEVLPDINEHPIYVESKKNVTDASRLFQKLTSWLNRQPAAYALKMMDVEIRKAEVALYKKFLGISRSWTGILWKTSKIDETNPSLDLKDFILQYISNTIESPNFNGSIIQKYASQNISNKELINIYNGANYISENYTEGRYAMTGDLFVVEDTDGQERYLINIRPLCDLLRNNKNSVLYCLKGSAIDNPEALNRHLGQIIQKASHEIIPYIADKKAICFEFNELVVEEWNTLKERLIGRLLPPFSLHIQQRYSQYLHRIGLPRIPDGYFSSMEKCSVSASSQSIG